MSLPIAIQLYSLREEAEEDFFGTLKKVKEMGFDGVEFAGLFDNEPGMVKSFCEEIGLLPVSAHVPFDMLLNETDKVISDYSALGCKYVAVPYMTFERHPGTELFMQTIDEIRKIGEKFKAAGITLLYHNHDFEFIEVDGKYGLDIIYSEIDPDTLQTEIDTCWVKFAGVDPSEYIEKYSGRSPVVHLKDFVSGAEGCKPYQLIGIESDADDEDEDAFSFMPVGSGCQNMPSILCSSVKAGANWVVVEQDRPNEGNTPINAAKQSIDYLKSFDW